MTIFEVGVGLNRGALSQLETMTGYSDAKKINYAWNVYQSEDKYTSEERQLALNYLKNYYDVTDPDTLSKLVALQPFEKIKTIEPSKTLPETFFEHANETIQEVNELITKYNKTTDSKKRIKLLQKIYEQYQFMQFSFNSEMVEDCEPFQQQIEHLFTQLKQQLPSDSMTKLEKPKLKVEALSASDTLVEMIANMSTEEISKFAGLLHQEALKKLAKRAPNEVKEFLQKNEIRFLGGGNSKNYLITPNDGNPSYVLKLECGFGNPKFAEQHLRQQLGSVFAQEAICRQVFFDDESKKSARFMTITEHCGGGDLQSYGESIKGSKIDSAIDVFSQMAQILIGIEKNLGVFPDMKNANWLMDRNNKLRIADTKSLFFSSEGKVDYKKNKSQGLPYVNTPYMNPRSDTIDGCSVDKLHAFMFGKNLYHYLTGCRDEYLDNKFDGASLDFEHRVFQGPGSQFKDLICSLIKANPEERCSMGEALKTLKHIKKYHPFEVLFEQFLELDNTREAKEYVELCREKLKGFTNIKDINQLKTEIQQLIKDTLPSKCRELLDKIKKHGFGESDTFMQEYIKEVEDDLKNHHNLEDLKIDLEETLKDLENPILTEIHRVIDDFKNRNRWHTRGMESKAMRIEAEMAKLSIPCRVNLMKDKNLEKTLQFVMEQMGTHRILGGELFLTTENKIDETKASPTYHGFKQKLQKIKQEENDKTTKLKPK